MDLKTREIYSKINQEEDATGEWSVAGAGAPVDPGALSISFQTGKSGKKVHKKETMSIFLPFSRMCCVDAQSFGEGGRIQAPTHPKQPPLPHFPR